jgi:ATP-dependent DNA helicase RecG
VTQAPSRSRDTLTERLRKVLQLERVRRWNDSAVVGGLDRFLQTAVQKGLAENSPAREWISNLPAGGYGSLSPTERRAWIDATLRALGTQQPAPPQRPVRRAVARQPRPRSVNDPVTSLKGVQAKTAEKLAKLGLSTVRDLLYYFPFRHNDYANLRTVSELTPGQDETVRVQVWSAKQTQLGSRRGSEATVGDESGMMHVVWFNQPWVATSLRTNSEILLAGRVSLYKGRPTFENPEYEPWDEGEELTHTGRLVPVYRLTKEVTGRNLRRLVRQALDSYLDVLSDPLPQALRKRLNLIDLRRAVQQAHFPESEESLAEARRRLAVDEMLPLQISVLLRRQEWQQPGTAEPIAAPGNILTAFRSALPFMLTGAQERALGQLLDDLARDVPMSRLLQGDVGSGKTVVAACGALLAAAAGRQAAVMAPTEVLAEQHFRTLCSLFGADASDRPLARAELPYLNRPLNIALLTGSLRPKERAEVYEAIGTGHVAIAVGTHALIQEGLTFDDLAFVVVDEQHRFGVMQRAALRGKSGTSVHMLVMTATPIPRSLYLTLYGDLDVSVIDELPPGRKPIETRWLPPDQREHAQEFIRGQVTNGRQAFVICPLVEESEALQAKSAVQEHQRLSEQVFPDLNVELVHGRMSARDKDAAMRRFREGDAHILVSTSVIEVGIDVPSATVMLIEGADRFGLAQLHQFRGRVGRGAEQSYCLLLSESPSLDAQERLKLMETTTDGFRLAEADLRLRGPGEFFGTRQSGLPDFRVASLLDTRLIEMARAEAGQILNDDPQLAKPEHAALATEVRRLYEHVSGEVH